MRPVDGRGGATPSALIGRCTRQLRRGVAMFGIAVLGIAASGCGDPSGPRSVVAVYELQAIGGNPLPYEFPDSQVRHGISSGRITLFSDRRFTDVEERFEGPVGAERMSTSESAGRYTMRTGSIELAYPRVEWIITTFEGTLDGDELTVNYLWGGSYRYRKVP